jgi:hypothetical protein
MDAAVATDEVFLGRYVLIEYDEDRTRDTNIAVGTVKRRSSSSDYYYAYMSQDDLTSRTRVRYEDATSTVLSVTKDDKIYYTDTS